MTPRILSVKYAASRMKESAFFPDGDRETMRPIVFLLFVIFAEGRTVLVDAGCESLEGFVLTERSSPVEALRAAGVEKNKITDLILTHAHYDHVACAGEFGGAVIHIQKEEYERAKSYLPSEARVECFDERHTVCEGVTAVKIGGHSRGSSVVEVRGEGTTFVIAGDECYSYENLEKGIPTGTSVCPEKSLAFLKRYGTEEYTVLLMHEERKEKQ